MSERITEAELRDIVGRIEHAWQHEPGRDDFVRGLRLVAEVRRLRGLIALTHLAPPTGRADQIRCIIMPSMEDLLAEADAIRAEEA